jgi:hypothetical protein
VGALSAHARQMPVAECLHSFLSHSRSRYHQRRVKPKMGSSSTALTSLKTRLEQLLPPGARDLGRSACVPKHFSNARFAKSSTTNHGVVRRAAFPE